jgi:hypothetical protein
MLEVGRDPHVGWEDVGAHDLPIPLPCEIGAIDLVVGRERSDTMGRVEAKKKENFANRATADPETRCFPPGVPRLMYMPYPFQIFQTPTYLAFVHEYFHAVRHVYVNGTAHPRGPIDWWMGGSLGRWEGDTLVVDVVHFTDQTWFDRAGNFHSEALHLIERYTLISPDHINYEVTVEDPKVFTRPWKMAMILYRRKEPNAQLLEHECYAFDEVADPI